MFILIQPFPHGLKPLITISSRKKGKLSPTLTHFLHAFEGCTDYPCIIQKGVINIMNFVFFMFYLGKIQLYQIFVFAQFFVLLFQFSGALGKTFFISRKYNLQWMKRILKMYDGVREVEILFIFFFGSLQTISHV